MEQNASQHGLVSVVMPNYNGAEFIAESVRSVLAQTYTDWELIVVDDRSTDASFEVLAQFDDARIKVIVAEQNGGAARARNLAIQAAKGRWIAFLDSDDLWKPDKLARQLAFMTERNAVLSCTHYDVINAEGALVTTFEPSKDAYTYRDILGHCSIGCLTAMYDADALGKVEMPVAAVKNEDFACWLSILRQGHTAACLHVSLAAYRVHTGSVSSNKLRMIKWQWNVYRRVERLGFFRSCGYMVRWAISGLFKYRKKRKKKG